MELLARAIGFLPLLIYGEHGGSVAAEAAKRMSMLMKCALTCHSVVTTDGFAAGVKGTPMPHRVPITVVMGKPFSVPHIAEPTQEQVQPSAGCMQSMTVGPSARQHVTTMMQDLHANTMW